MATLVERAMEFWENHVAPGVPPPLRGDPSTARYLAERFPSHTEELRPATPEAMELLGEYRAAKAAHEAAARRRDLAKHNLKALVGNASGIEGVCTWRKRKDSFETDWEAVARACNAPLSLIDAHTTRKPGQRSFRAIGGNNGSDE